MKRFRQPLLSTPKNRNTSSPQFTLHASAKINVTLIYINCMCIRSLKVYSLFESSPAKLSLLLLLLYWNSTIWWRWWYAASPRWDGMIWHTIGCGWRSRMMYITILTWTGMCVSITSGSRVNISTISTYAGMVTVVTGARMNITATVTAWTRMYVTIVVTNWWMWIGRRNVWMQMWIGTVRIWPIIIGRWMIKC